MTSTPATTTTPEEIDPIDVLIPPPRQRFVRLAIAVVVLGVIGGAGYLWGLGHIYPNPDCCGGGSSGPIMALTPDGEAVTITGYIFNSSPKNLTITGASADLPGARVLDIQVLPDENGMEFPVRNAEDFPVALPKHHDRRLVITFVPEVCVSTDDWGSATVDLSIADSWLPSIGRSYRLPEALVPSGDQMSVFSPSPVIGGIDPLATACTILGR